MDRREFLTKSGVAAAGVGLVGGAGKTATARGASVSLADLPDLRWAPDAAVTVVVAAENYPDTPRTGDPIEGLDAADGVPDAYVLHAGTQSANGAVVSAGGRVLSVVGTGPDPSQPCDSHRNLTTDG